MKKLLMTLIVLTLFVFGLSTSALAASPAQDSNCPGNTTYWKILDANNLSGSDYLNGMDDSSLFDTLKSYINSCGGSDSTQDNAGVNSVQDIITQAQSQNCPAANAPQENTVADTQDSVPVADAQQDSAPVADTQDSAPVADAQQDSAPAADTQDSAPAADTQDSAPAADTQDSAPAADTQDSAPAASTPSDAKDCPATYYVTGSNGRCITINSDLSSLAERLRAYGIYMPDICTGDTQSDDVNVPTDDANVPTDDANVPTDDANVPTDDASAPSDNTADASYAQQVTNLVNEQRAANGLAPLTLSSDLSRVAQAKSQDMHDNNYFDHNSPTYGSPFDMMKAFGISYRSAGENIAMGYATPEAVVNAWMNSPGHRANILNSSYSQIGVGYVADGNYWTQEFIG